MTCNANVMFTLLFIETEAESVAQRAGKWTAVPPDCHPPHLDFDPGKHLTVTPEFRLHTVTQYKHNQKCIKSFSDQNNMENKSINDLKKKRTDPFSLSPTYYFFCFTVTTGLVYFQLQVLFS